MTQQEYENQKHECWEEFKEENLSGEVQWQPVSRYDVFCAAFDRAYALGKAYCAEAGAEEETLSVSRKRVQEIYSYNEEILSQDPGHSGAILLKKKLTDLFGSKCLPDNVDSSDANVDSLHGNVDSSKPKPAEPKFKVGDTTSYVCSPTLKHKCTVTKVMQNEHSGKWEYNVMFEWGKPGMWIPESDLEPYEEPEGEVSKMKPIESKVSVYIATKEEDEEFRLLLHKNGFTWHMGNSLISHTHWSSDIEDCKMYYVYSDKTVTYYGKKTSDTLTFSEFKKRYFEKESHNISQDFANCDKQFDNILKDSFREHNRLQIAAMAMQGILSNEKATQYAINNFRCSDGALNRYWGVAECSLAYADALIAESEKGGDHE